MEQIKRFWIPAALGVVAAMVMLVLIGSIDQYDADANQNGVTVTPDNISPEFTPQATKDSDYGTVVVTRLVSIYDGDTFRVDIEGWPDLVGKNMPIRVNGIDTPERRDKNEHIKALAQVAKEFVVTTLRSAETIELRNMERGKYFRIIADVYVDGQSLADMLIKEGLAKPYDGGTKSAWTEEDYERYFNGNPN